MTLVSESKKLKLVVASLGYLNMILENQVTEQEPMLVYIFHIFIGDVYLSTYNFFYMGPNSKIFMELPSKHKSAIFCFYCNVVPYSQGAS